MNGLNIPHAAKVLQIRKIAREENIVLDRAEGLTTQEERVQAEQQALRLQHSTQGWFKGLWEKAQRSLTT